MCHHDHSMSFLDSLMSGPRHKHDHMSWTKIAITGAIVYMGAKVLMDMMDDDD